MKQVLKLMAVTVALLFLLGAMLTAVTELFGGSKVRPLFGMSMDALAGPPVDGGQAKVKPSNANSANNANAPNDFEPTRFSASKSAPVPLPRRVKDGGAPVFFPASKSAGGEGLPGLSDEPQPQAPPPSPQQQSPTQAR